jgi:polysaccharide biosynthesis transport protein
MQSKQSQKQSDNLPEISETVEIDLQKIVQILKRHWLFGTGIFAALMLIILLVIVRQKPSYQASGTVLVEKPENQSLLGLGINVGDLDSLQGTAPVVTQTELIKAVPLIQQTIDKLSLTDSDGSPLIPEDFLKRLRIESVPRADILKVTYTGKDPQETAEVINTVMQIYVNDNLKINRTKVTATRKFIEQQLPRVEESVREIEGAVRRFNETNRIVSLEDESKAAIDISTTLDQSLVDVGSKLAGASARSEELRQKIEIDPQQATTRIALSQSSGVQTALKEYQDLQRQLAEQLTRYKPGYPAIEQLQRQVDAARSIVQRRAGEIAPNQPTATLSGADLQMGQFKTELVSNYVNAEVQRIDLLNQFNSLSNSRSVQERRMNRLPRLKSQQSELQRRLQASQTTFQALLTQLQEIKIAEQQTIGNARIVSAAAPPQKPTLLTSGLGKSVLVLVGALVSAGLGVAAIFITHLLDRKLRTMADAKEIFGYPILGMIPNYSESTLEQVTQSLSKVFQDQLASMQVVNSKVVVRDSPRSPASAAFQMLQTNIKFLSSDKRARVIIVSSSIPGEGKSEVASNLSATLAQVGRRVLLIDADMRRPRQHKMWDLASASPGLSNLLVEESQVNQVTQSLMPNLSIIPAGTLPPNPVALLDSERMAALIQEFRQAYDYVIIDTPPLAGIADATILGKMTDGVLLVTRIGVCTLASARASRQFLKQGEQNVLGLVVNDVNSSNEPDSYFYGAYYYYGAGNKETQDEQVTENNQMNGMGTGTASKLLRNHRNR